MTGTEQVARIARMFAQAAIDPAAWLPALRALGSATNSGHGELVIIGAPGTALAPQSWMSGGTPIAFDAFIAAGGYGADANPRIASSLNAPALAVVHERHYDAVQPSLPNGEGVREMFVQGRIEAGCQAALIQDEQLLVGLAVLRGGRDGRTSAADRATFKAVLPYVRDAALVHLGIERQGAAMMAGAFEAMAAAAFLLDRGGRVLAQTPAAERLLRDGRLRLEEGRLAGVRGPQAVALARAIAPRLVPSRRVPPPLATVTLAGRDGAPTLMADVSALPPRDWSFGRSPAVLVVVRGGALRREGAAALVRDAWDLSRAEAEVVVALAAGQSRATIAVARGVSVETVRAQLKSIFVKVGVTREAELATRAAALIGST